MQEERAVIGFFRPGLETWKAGNRQQGPGWGQRNDGSIGSPSNHRDLWRVHTGKGSHKRAPRPTQTSTQGSQQREMLISFILVFFSTRRFRGVLDWGCHSKICPQCSHSLNVWKYVLLALGIVDPRKRSPQKTQAPGGIDDNACF